MNKKLIGEGVVLLLIVLIVLLGMSWDPGKHGSMLSRFMGAEYGEYKGGFPWVNGLALALGVTCFPWLIVWLCSLFSDRIQEYGKYFFTLLFVILVVVSGIWSCLSGEGCSGGRYGEDIYGDY